MDIEVNKLYFAISSYYEFWLSSVCDRTNNTFVKYIDNFNETIKIEKGEIFFCKLKSKRRSKKNIEQKMKFRTSLKKFPKRNDAI